MHMHMHTRLHAEGAVDAGDAEGAARAFSAAIASGNQQGAVMAARVLGTSAENGGCDGYLGQLWMGVGRIQ